MLRLPATRIGLAAADIEWHANRHNDRQSRRANGIPFGELSNGSDSHDDRPGKRFPPFPSKSRSARKTEEISIFTDEPVPKDSREFWDKILAGAGTSSRVFSAISPQASSPLLKNSGSAAATAQENRADAIEPLENVRSLGEAPTALISPRSPLSSQVSEGSPISPLSLERHASLESGENERDRTGLTGEIASTMVDEAGEPLETMSRMSPRPEKEGPRRYKLPGFPNQMDLDGPADVGPCRWKYRKRSSLVHLLGESESRSTDSPDRPQSPHTLPRATSLSLSLTESDPRSIGMPFGNHVRMAEWSAARLRRVNPFEGSVSNSLPLNDAQLLNAREPIQPQLDIRPSPPRNVSQSIASKTPEQPYNSAIELNGRDIRGETRLLSQPPRRKKRYRRRSQTYSYLQSAASLEATAQFSGESLDTCNHFDNSNPHQRSNSSTQGSFGPHERQTSASLALSLPELIRNPTYLDSNPSQSMNYHQPQFSSSFSRCPDHNLAHPYPTDVEASPFPSSSRALGHSSTLPTRIVPSLSSPIHPPPASFHTNWHRASSSSALPFGSPFFENNHHHQTGLTVHDRARSLPRHHVSHASLSSSASPSRIRVYDDSLPSHSQPQTPVGLPRNGLPRMGWTNPELPPAWRVGRLRPFSTMPARRRWMRDEDVFGP
ncbi:MAG: hypothetical protein Q9214_000678 [Letrouitia sp. 1 TL-2023]